MEIQKIDVTYYPERSQNDVASETKVIEHKEPTEQFGRYIEMNPDIVKTEEKLSVLTLERLILFYKALAKKDDINKNAFNATAIFLNELKNNRVLNSE